jgi:hypothetical protein
MVGCGRLLRSIWWDGVGGIEVVEEILDARKGKETVACFILEVVCVSAGYGGGDEMDWIRYDGGTEQCVVRVANGVWCMAQEGCNRRDDDCGHGLFHPTPSKKEE